MNQIRTVLIGILLFLPACSTLSENPYAPLIPSAEERGESDTLSMESFSTETPDPAITAVLEEPAEERGEPSRDVLVVKEIEDPPGENLPVVKEEPTPQYDVPIVVNASVEKYVQYFQTTIKDRFQFWLARSGRYLPIMKEILKEYGLPEDLVFVALIESGFNPAAYSRSRAVGPWQFIKGTGLRYGLEINEWVDERRDPIKSTHAAARYLKDLYKMFGSWPLALASYNAGEGRVARAIRRVKSDNFWDLRTSRFLHRETRDYVPKYMAATIIAKDPEKYGFNLELWDPLQFEEVTVEYPTDLRVIAKAAGVTYKTIRELNPELRTSITPIDRKNYLLKLPLGSRETFQDNFSKVPLKDRNMLLKHRVRRGETLSHLARQYGTSIRAIRQLNGLRSVHFIREGKHLMIPVGKRMAYLQDDDLTALDKRQTIRYRVRSGDTLSRLARQYGTSVRAIRDFNGLKNSNLIRKGHYLLIPVGPQRFALMDGTTTKIRYQVKLGDSLWKISRDFNIPIHKIRVWNGLRHRSFIRAGQQLVLYVPTQKS